MQEPVFSGCEGEICSVRGEPGGSIGAGQRPRVSVTYFIMAGESVSATANMSASKAANLHICRLAGSLFLS